MKYRKAELCDIQTLIELRKNQLADEGISPDKDIDEELLYFFTDKIKDKSLVEWVVEENEKIIATAAIIFYKFPPSYTNKRGIKGYITNMYTNPDYRGQGIAVSLMDRLVNEARSRNVKTLWLSASKMGKTVYLKCGFKETEKWMELDIGTGL